MPVDASGVSVYNLVVGVGMRQSLSESWSGSGGVPSGAGSDVTPMATLPTRAAAYTRTGILYRFLDELAAAIPQRVDNEYAEQRLGLKGGDIRAFLQSLRVLGLIDPYGTVTEAGRRTRSLSQRPAVLREALAAAYPELDQRWQHEGGMRRDAVEDFFKIEYGLSNSTAGPAAKLFCDLQREYGCPEAPAAEPAVTAGPGRTLGRSTSVAAQPVEIPVQDVRVAALDAVKNSLRVQINENWEPEKIELVFDRMERLMQLVVGKAD